MTPMLKFIPMPVLYGIFLYMGIASLNGLQFVDRVLLLITPQKYRPPYPYVKSVPLSVVHKFTAIQLLCIVVLFVMNEFKLTSIAVPLLLLVMIGIRKGLDRYFEKKHLKKLDDVLPEFSRHISLDEEDSAKHSATKPLDNGNGLVVPENDTPTDNKECNDKKIKIYNLLKEMTY